MTEQEGSMGWYNEQDAEFDLVGAIMDFEEGALDDTDVILLFAHLVKTGAAWSLQGSYGRTAVALIDAGVISPEGEVSWDVIDDLDDQA